MDLVDFQIAKYVEEGDIGITPYNPVNLQPNSYDVHLGDHYIVFSGVDRRRSGQYLPALEKPIDVRDPQALQKLLDSGHAHEVNCDEFTIYPGDAVLGHTIEIISLPPHIRAIINGKSSLARWFLEIHQTGGYIDAGFSGQITLEMTLGMPAGYPLTIYSGMPIAQLAFTVCTSCQVPYNHRRGAKYNNQMGATPSQYHKNF